MRSLRDVARFITVAAVVLSAAPLDAQEALPEIGEPPHFRWTGSVTLNVENEEVTSVLRLLSEAGKVNIIAGPEVSGAVTVNLYDVSFEEALTAILGVAGYTHYRLGNIIYVTTEDQKASLPPAAQDLMVRSFQIDHANPSDVLATVEALLSSSGKALLSSEKHLVVKGSAYNIELVEDLIKQLDVPPYQVLIAAHIVNVKREDNLNIGVGFDTIPLTQYGVEAVGSGFATAFPPRPTESTDTTQNGGQTTTKAETSTDEELSLGSGLYAGTLQRDSRAFIELLDDTSDVDILAAPQILALDGQMARIQVGDRLGFRVTTTTETASLESVEFLEVGTVLEVTPHIAHDGLVRMEIQPKVSSGFVTSGLPTESTTEVETNMLVRHGETIIIGGLLNATRQRVKKQIPVLGDIPVLGKLFGKNTWSDDKSEVVVFITPYIVGYEMPPEFADKLEAAKSRWGEFTEKGLINPETELLKQVPTERLRADVKEAAERTRSSGAPEPPGSDGTEETDKSDE